MNNAVQAPQRQPLRALGWLLLPSILAAALAGLLMAWRAPTGVELDLRVDRVGFVVDAAAEEPVRALAAIDFDALSIRSFQRIALASQRVERADPALFDLQHDRFPDHAGSH